MRNWNTLIKTRIASGAFAIGLVANYAAGEELVLSSWLPPQHPVTVGLIQPWMESVAEATDGRVTVRMLPKPLGPPPAHFDLAAEGVADITYGLHSFTRDDRFLRSRIGQFSFLGETAEAISLAYWDVYGGDLDAQDEHQGTKLLGLFVHGPGMLHNNQRKIESPDDFAGLKIRTPGGYIAQLAEGLGITTQFMGPGEVFEKLSTGVIDGVTFPLEAIAAFNLGDHLSHTLTVPGGMYNTSWFLVMNEDRWNDISAEDQAAIEAVSGEALAQLAGQVWDAADARGMGAVEAATIEIHGASEAVLSRITEVAEELEGQWVLAVDAQGFDAAAALENIRTAAAQ